MGQGVPRVPLSFGRSDWQGQVPSDLSIFFENGLFRWNLPNLTLVQCNKDTLHPHPCLAVLALIIFTHGLMAWHNYSTPMLCAELELPKAYLLSILMDLDGSRGQGISPLMLIGLS